MILVLVCMFMVSLIGAMILSTTLINYKMKIAQKQEIETFYSAEAVMEEVSVRVRQKVLDAYRSAYEDLLLNYLKPEVAEDRQAYFMEHIAEYLQLNPEKRQMSGREVLVAKELGVFVGISTEVNHGLGIWGSFRFALSDGAIVDVGKQELRLPDVHLEFMNENGVKTTIDTDMVVAIAMPDDKFETAGTQVNRYMDDYVVIANRDIISDAAGTNGAGGTTAVVEGSLYAGKRFEVKSGLAVNGDRIVVGETLFLPDGSSMHATTGQFENDGIWARNVELKGGSLELNGDCYVVDDTTFSAENSKMVIQNGGYYGYSYSEKTEGDPYLSSAILINKPNITLDLSGADMLWLAGNAYIREEKLFDELGAADEGIMEGESLAYKNMQAAYMVPGSCIVGVGHNPIVMSQRFSMEKGETLTNAYMISEQEKRTEAEMDVVDDMQIGAQNYHAGDKVPSGTLLPVGTVLPAKTVLPCDISTPIVDMLVNTTKDGTYFTEDGYYIDLTMNRAGIGIDISQYVDAREPFIVRYSNTKQRAYYYLRFLDSQNAADYFSEYLSQTEEGRKLLQQLRTLDASAILLPERENIVTVGNLTHYEFELTPEDAEYGIVSENPGKNLLWKEALLTSSYNSLLTRLTPGGKLDTSAVPKESSEADVFSYLINPVRLAQADDEDSDNDDKIKRIVKHCQDEEGNSVQLCVIYHDGEDDFTVPTESLRQSLGTLTNAVIITNGNVTVNTEFAGVIIAKGDVKFQISGEGEKLEGNISIADLLRHKEIGPYFNAYQTPDEGSQKQEHLLADELLQIRYDGWKKN